MKKFTLIFMSLVLAFLLGANTAQAQTTLLTYTVNGDETEANTAYTAYNGNGEAAGTVSYGAAKVEKKTINKVDLYGYKLDGDGGTKYALITLDDGTFLPGDEIVIKGFATSSTNGSNHGFLLTETDDTEVRTVYLPKGNSNTVWEVLYTIEANDGIANKNAFKIFRAYQKSTYMCSVTIYRYKTIVNETTILSGVKVNDEAISSDDFDNLLADKTVTLSNSYVIAPKVVFNTTKTTTYTEGDPDVVNGTVEAVVTEEGNTFVATATVGTDEYTVIMNKDFSATLDVTPASVKLVSETMTTATATIEVVGANLTASEVTITLPDVAGLTCDKATLPIENGSVNGTITLTYKSVEDVAEAIVNVSLAAGETTATIAVTYSSTAVVTEIVPVTEATVWDWATAVNDKDKDINPISSQYGEYFANYEGWKNTFNAAALKGTGSSFYRSGYECFQGKSLTFNAGVSGKLTVVYSNTSKDSSNGVRDLYVNGVATNTAVYKANGKDENEKITASLYVSAGLVALSAKQIIDKNGNTIDAPTDADLRIYSITFTPMVSVTVGNTGYSTLYYSNASLTVPEGISGWTFTASGEGLAADETYPAGSVIPADVAVVLYTKTPGDYEFAAVAGTAGTLPAANLLHGTDVAEEVTTDGTPYILASGSNGIGFYQAAPEGGKTFTNGAHKAYLETPASMPKAPAFILNLGGTTGAQIITVDNEAAEGATYNVLGQKVGNNYKGFVVKNGQKTINK